MQHVFLLLVYLGTGEARKLSSGDMYFASIHQCNYFASQVTKQYGNGVVAEKDTVTAYCVPKRIKLGSKEIYR